MCRVTCCSLAWVWAPSGARTGSAEWVVVEHGWGVALASPAPRGGLPEKAVGGQSMGQEDLDFRFGKGGSGGRPMW